MQFNTKRCGCCDASDQTCAVDRRKTSHTSRALLSIDASSVILPVPIARLVNRGSTRSSTVRSPQHIGFRVSDHCSLSPPTYCSLNCTPLQNISCCNFQGGITFFAVKRYRQGIQEDFSQSAGGYGDPNMEQGGQYGQYAGGNATDPGDPYQSPFGNAGQQGQTQQENYNPATY